tara:strand:- start:2582 stop:3469 length:888 start_codon:yes stop_codon:yes gene_type:complete
MTDTKEKIDYLSVDNPIPGQNYVCMSFVSPEKLIQDFKAFQMCKFLQSYCKDLDLKYDEIYSKYEDYIYKYSEELQRDYDEKNEYKTSMRGIKVRGVYNTKGEAENRAKSLSRTDSTFNVFVGQVGYWLPWDPCADNVEKEVFQNEQLNKLMEGYEKNNINREIFYEELKQDKIQAAKDEYMAAKKKREEEKKLEEENKRAEDKVKEIEGNDNNDNNSDTVTEGTTLEEVKDEPLPEENVDYTLNKDINDSMEDIDPWMARKLEESKSNVNDTGDNTDNTTNDSANDSAEVVSNQ